MRKQGFVVSIHGRAWSVPSGLALGVALLLSFGEVAMADIAPDPVQLDGTTRMTSESVTIEVDKEVARVTATFRLEVGNLEKLRYCRALQEGGSECGDWYYHFSLLWPVLDTQDGAFRDFAVTVNGEECDIWGDQEEEVPGIEPPISKWIRISAPRMDKRPKKVEVVVKYTEVLKPRLGLAQLTYVLRSGALWKDRIGSAVVTVKVRDGVVLGEATPPPKSAARDKLVWKFADFEPDKDISVVVRLPLSAQDEEWRRKYEELVRKNSELDSREAELRIEEDKLDATYQEYLKAQEELRKKQAPLPEQQPPAPEQQPSERAPQSW